MCWYSGLKSGRTRCSRCAELWSHPDGDGYLYYKLSKSMKTTWAYYYKNGRRNVMCCWDSMVEAKQLYDEEVASIQEVCDDIAGFLEKASPHMTFTIITKTFLCESGVLFKDARRSEICTVGWRWTIGSTSEKLSSSEFDRNDIKSNCLSLWYLSQCFRG